MSPRLAVFTKNLTNPAYQAARFGADRVAARFGAATAHYVPREPDSVPEQRELVAAAIAAKPDAFVFTPVHETGMNNQVLAIEAAGIPMVGFVTRATVGRPLCFIGSDDPALARDVARYLFARMGGKGEIVIFDGLPASATSRDRSIGFHDALREYPGIAVRSSICGDYSRAVSRDAWLKAGDSVRGVDAVLCANDVMALGVLDALKSVPGNPERPLLAGVNAIPEAIEKIAAGEMLATVNFDAMAMASLATEAAVRHLRGEAVPSRIMLPVEVVDRANCARWGMPFTERVPISWDEAVALAG